MDSLIVKTNQPDQETGLIIKNSHLATSGFKYQTGIRQFGDLKIVEGVSKGTASFFLVSLMVFDQRGTLLFDGEVNKLTNYSREAVRQMVLDGLMSMLREAAEREGKYFDEFEAYELIDKKLKNAYYEQSYIAVLDWAEKMGIKVTSLKP
jgi:hypothetical protein